MAFFWGGGDGGRRWVNLDGSPRGLRPGSLASEVARRHAIRSGLLANFILHMRVVVVFTALSSGVKV